MDQTNYAISYRLTNHTGHEFTCMICFKTWWVMKTFDERTRAWYTLPTWCRDCDVAVKVPADE